MRFHMGFRSTLRMVAFLLTVWALPASAQDKATQGIYDAVGKLQRAGKHADALKKLDGQFKAAWPTQAKVLKADSLAATGKGLDAWKLLAGAESEPGVKEALARIGATLPAQPVRVTSTPSGADVSINGGAAQPTPATVSLTPGAHEATFRKAGFGELKKGFNVVPEVDSYLSVTLDATTGNVEVTVQETGLTATAGAVKRELAVGKNALGAFPAGGLTIAFLDASGKKLGEKTVTVASGETAEASFATFGTLKTPWSDGTLEVVPEPPKEGEAAPAADKKTQKLAELRLAEGSYKVIAHRPGFYPVKGSVQVTPGQVQVLSVDVQPILDRGGLEIGSITGIGVGLAMVATATVMEIGDFGKTGAMDATKFTLVGVGGGLFVASGIVLKWLRSDRISPEARDGTFTIQVGGLPLMDGGLLTATGGF